MSSSWHFCGLNFGCGPSLFGHFDWRQESKAAVIEALMTFADSHITANCLQKSFGSTLDGLVDAFGPMAAEFYYHSLRS